MSLRLNFISCQMQIGMFSIMQRKLTYLFIGFENLFWLSILFHIPFVLFYGLSRSMLSAHVRSLYLDLEKCISTYDMSYSVSTSVSVLYIVYLACVCECQWVIIDHRSYCLEFDFPYSGVQTSLFIIIWEKSNNCCAFCIWYSYTSIIFNS